MPVGQGRGARDAASSDKGVGHGAPVSGHGVTTGHRVQLQGNHFGIYFGNGGTGNFHSSLDSLKASIASSNATRILHEVHECPAINLLQPRQQYHTYKKLLESIYKGISKHLEPKIQP